MKIGIWMMLFVFAALFPAAAWATLDTKGAELSDENMDSVRGAENAGVPGWDSDTNPKNQAEKDKAAMDELKKAEETLGKDTMKPVTELLAQLEGQNMPVKDKLVLILMKLSKNQDAENPAQAESRSQMTDAVARAIAASNNIE